MKTSSAVILLALAAAGFAEACPRVATSFAWGYKVKDRLTAITTSDKHECAQHCVDYPDCNSFSFFPSYQLCEFSAASELEQVNDVGKFVDNDSGVVVNSCEDRSGYVVRSCDVSECKPSGSVIAARNNQAPLAKDDHTPTQDRSCEYQCRNDPRCKSFSVTTSAGACWLYDGPLIPGVWFPGHGVYDMVSGAPAKVLNAVPGVSAGCWTESAPGVWTCDHAGKKYKMTLCSA